MKELKFLFPGTLRMKPQLVLRSRVIVRVNACDVSVNTMQLWVVRHVTPAGLSDVWAQCCGDQSL